MENRNYILHKISLLLFSILIIGFFYSNALKSITLVGLSGLFIFHTEWRKEVRFIFKNKIFISSLILISIYVFSAIISTDKIMAIKAINNKIAIVCIPISIYLLKYSKKEIIYLFILYTTAALIQILYALYHAVFFEKITDLYSIGNVLPVIKIHHVQIATLISFGILFLIVFIENIRSIKLKIIAAVLTIIFIFFIHYFAVRTGIILTYTLLITYLSYQVVTSRNWKLIGIISVIILIVSVIIFQTSNTLKTKINYMRYDITQYLKNAENAYQYSDSRRLQSIKNGIIVLQKNPIFGAGIGDLYKECATIYKQQNPTLKKEFFFLPHNQYIYYLSTFGYILGGIAILCFIYPLFYFIKNKNVLLISIYISLLMFAIWDAFMGTLFGTCIYAIIIGLGMKQKN